jgi:hypothetical protein
VIELLVSVLCLASLIVVLLEVEEDGGFRRRWPILLWIVSLCLLGLHVLVRVYQNADLWSPERIFMAFLAAGNFVLSAILLARRLLGLRRRGVGTRAA